MSNVRSVGSGSGIAEESEPFPCEKSSALPAPKGVLAATVSPSVAALVSGYRSDAGGALLSAAALERKPVTFQQLKQAYVAACGKLDRDISKLRTYAAYCDDCQRALEADRKARRPLPEGLEGLPWYWADQARLAREEVLDLKQAFSVVRERYEIAVGLSQQSYLGQMQAEDVERLKQGVEKFRSALETYNRAVEGIKNSSVLATGFSAALLVNELRGKGVDLYRSADVADIAGRAAAIEDGIKHRAQSRPVVTWSR
jgi:hypothetical protein